MFASAAIRTKDLGQHRLPGVCVSILGFGLIFTGVMMMGVDGIAKKNAEKAIQIAGPICLAFGGAAIIAGFTTQYILHKRHKKLLLRLKKAREKVKKSVEAITNKPDGSAAKYLDITSEDPVFASTSHSSVPPITMNTVLDTDEALTEKMNIQYLYQDFVNRENQFLDFNPQTRAFDDSSDEEYVVCGPTETEAVIEYRRQSHDSTFSRESSHSGSRIKVSHKCTQSTPSTPNGREPDGGIATNAKRETIHISSMVARADAGIEPDDTSASNCSYNSAKCDITYISPSNSLEDNQFSSEPERSISAVSMASSASKSSTQNSGSDFDEVRSGILQKNCEQNMKKRNRHVKFIGHDFNRLPDIAQGHKNTTIKQGYELNVDVDAKPDHLKQDVCLEVPNLHRSLIRSYSDSLSINTQVSKIHNLTGMMSTSWISAESIDVFDTMNLSKSFSEPKDLPSVERPSQLELNTSSSLSSSRSGSRENIREETDHSEKIPRINKFKIPPLNIHYLGGDDDRDDEAACTVNKVYGILNGDISQVIRAKKRSPKLIHEEVSNTESKKRVDRVEQSQRLKMENHVRYDSEANNVSNLELSSNVKPIKETRQYKNDRTEINGLTFSNGSVPKRHSKGKTTKHGKCKNIREKEVHVHDFGEYNTGQRKLSTGSSGEVESTA